MLIFFLMSLNRNFLKWPLTVSTYPINFSRSQKSISSIYIHIIPLVLCFYPFLNYKTTVDILIEVKDNYSSYSNCKGGDDRTKVEVDLYFTYQNNANTKYFSI